LKTLEGQQPVNATSVVVKNDCEEDEMQLTFSSGAKEELINKLKDIDVNTLTPIEAMTKLFELQKEANSI
jgi:DNA mismatch repair protein MutS